MPSGIPMQLLLLSYPKAAAALRELWDNSTEVDKDKGNLVRPPENLFQRFHPLVPLSLCCQSSDSPGWCGSLFTRAKTASKVAFEAGLACCS